MSKERKAKQRGRSIVTGYLEKVSAAVFYKYRKEITDMTKGQQGVYALYCENKLYYVGLATNLRNRILNHLKDKHKDQWTHFSLYVIRKTEHIKELESLLQHIVPLRGNTVKGKLQTSIDLMPTLLERVEETHEQEIIAIFKGTRSPLAKSHKKSRSGGKGGFPLKGLVVPWKRIYATYKGKSYKAMVYPSGRIRMGERFFDTPTAAAKSIIEKGAVNGWTFWRVKNSAGRLVKLATVRR